MFDRVQIKKEEKSFYSILYINTTRWNTSVKYKSVFVIV